MQAQFKIDRVKACEQWLCDGEAFTHSDSIDFLIDKLGELSVSLAFINSQMALAKKVLNDKKVTAYNSLIGSSVANETYFAPSLAKDYIAARCSEEAYNFDLCERVSRSIVHTIDSVRTAVSALKEQSKALSYANQALS